MTTRLTGLDASFLYLETSTAHMHVGAVLVLDPSTAPGGTLDRRRLAEYIETRLHLAPPYRRRLKTVPFRLDHPVWVEDPDFDLDFHVRSAALPAPGGNQELAAFAGDVMSRRLDRAHPLWELHLVEGLADGRVAVVTKTHHAAIDGASGAELAAVLLQLAPDQEPPPAEREWSPEAEPSDLRLVGTALLRAAATPMGALRLARRAVEAGAGLVRASLTSDTPAPPAPFAAPPTALNGAIGPHRRICLTEVGLADVKRVKNAAGATVNDVILAAVAGALRRYLGDRGDPVDRPLVAMVPISVRTEGQRGELGNRVSSMLVSLPVDEPDPLERLHLVSRSTAGAKERHGALGANTIQEAAELLPAGLAALAARLYTRLGAADRHRPIWNLVVSNVPGPRIPLYLAGARVEGMYPLGPVHEMSGLNVTLFSYGDSVCIGLNADRELVPDVEAVGEALAEAVTELDKAAER